MDAGDLRRLAASELTEIDRAVVILWHDSREGNLVGLTPSEVAVRLQGGGAARVNMSRLRKRLEADSRIVKSSNGAFRVNPRKEVEARQIAEPIFGPTRPDVALDVLDSGLFANAHGYVKNVVQQINISYENDCQDCAAVMIRRLFETLVVDAFEAKNCLSEITDSNGNIFQLSGLITALNRTSSFSVSRQTKQAASHLKDVGDWSAHNRRHRARKSDIDAVARHLRLASGDLLHLSGQD